MFNGPAFGGKYAVFPRDHHACLKCPTEGEAIVFPVTAVCDNEISDLKEFIQSKRALGSLKDVDPHALTKSHQIQLRHLSTELHLQIAVISFDSAWVPGDPSCVVQSTVLSWREARIYCLKRLGYSGYAFRCTINHQ